MSVYLAERRRPFYNLPERCFLGERTPLGALLYRRISRRDLRAIAISQDGTKTEMISVLLTLATRQENPPECDEIFRWPDERRHRDISSTFTLRSYGKYESRTPDLSESYRAQQTRSLYGAGNRAVNPQTASVSKSYQNESRLMSRDNVPRSVRSAGRCWSYSRLFRPHPVVPRKPPLRLSYRFRDQPHLKFKWPPCTP